MEDLVGQLQHQCFDVNVIEWSKLKLGETLAPIPTDLLNNWFNYFDIYIRIDLS